MARKYVLAPPDTPIELCYRKRWHPAVTLPPWMRATTPIDLVEQAIGTPDHDIYLLIDDDED